MTDLKQLPVSGGIFVSAPERDSIECVISEPEDIVPNLYAGLNGSCECGIGPPDAEPSLCRPCVALCGHLAANQLGASGNPTKTHSIACLFCEWDKAAVRLQRVRGDVEV